MQPPAHACPISCSCGTIGPPSQEPLLPPTARTLSQALTTDLPTQAFGPCCNSSRLRGSDCREAVGTANQPMHLHDRPQHRGSDHHPNTTDSLTGVRPLLQQQQAQGFPLSRGGGNRQPAHASAGLAPARGNGHHHNTTDSPTGVRPLLQQQQAQGFPLSRGGGNRQPAHASAGLAPARGQRPPPQHRLAHRRSAPAATAAGTRGTANGTEERK